MKRIKMTVCSIKHINLTTAFSSALSYNQKIANKETFVKAYQIYGKRET